MVVRCDVLVIGSGIAGLSFALSVAERADVVIVTKRAAEESNTLYAQGGIAAVLGDEDSFEQHVSDTMQAGAGLNHERVVDLCVHEGPQAIRRLEERGVHFDRKAGGAYDLHLEGGHAARRVAHVGDMTGREVEQALVDQARAHDRIRIMDEHMGVDLITLAKYGGPEVCAGAYVLDVRSGNVMTVLARETVLATGGAGKVYLYTSNPDVATGDGMAMAYRAGAEMANMEFFQFHPTCLFHPQAKSFLISEALRGEGAVLKRVDGTPFMRGHHELADLAPRDIVARAIDFEMKRSGADYVLLDISHKSEAEIVKHFPGIYAQCRAFGFDLAKEPIPVVPAAHYACGGVSTDLEGRTTIPGLWAIGETAHTGLHGANRLASNSLLEGVVFAERAARAMQDVHRDGAWPIVPEWDAGHAGTSDEAVIISHNWDELRRLMWSYVGIVRSSKRLRRAARRIALLQEEIAEYYWDHFVTRDLLELRNIACVAQLVVECAAARRESRGLHFTIDVPGPAEGPPRDTIIKRGVPAHARDVSLTASRASSRPNSYPPRQSG